MASDGMKQGDGMSFSLDCAHPNGVPGQRCQNCGKWIPLQEENKENEVRQSIPKDTGT